MVSKMAEQLMGQITVTGLKVTVDKENAGNMYSQNLTYGVTYVNGTNPTVSWNNMDYIEWVGVNAIHDTGRICDYDKVTKKLRIPHSLYTEDGIIYLSARGVSGDVKVTTEPLLLYTGPSANFDFTEIQEDPSWTEKVYDILMKVVDAQLNEVIPGIEQKYNDLAKSNQALIDEAKAQQQTSKELQEDLKSLSTTLENLKGQAQSQQAELQKALNEIDDTLKGYDTQFDNKLDGYDEQIVTKLSNIQTQYNQFKGQLQTDFTNTVKQWDTNVTKFLNDADTALDGKLKQYDTSVSQMITQANKEIDDAIKELDTTFNSLQSQLNAAMTKINTAISYMGEYETEVVGDDTRFRFKQGDGTWGEWITVAGVSGSYLPLAGGQLTGRLNLSSSGLGLTFPGETGVQIIQPVSDGSLLLGDPKHKMQLESPNVPEWYDKVAARSKPLALKEEVDKRLALTGGTVTGNLNINGQTNFGNIPTVGTDKKQVALAADVVSQEDYFEGTIEQGMTYLGKSSNKGIKLHSVQGKSEQLTTKGYQLFDASKLPTKSQYGATVTNNGDGSFTISGSGNLTDTFRLEYLLTHEETMKLFKQGNINAYYGAIVYPRLEFVLKINGKELINLNSSFISSTKVVTEEILSHSDLQLRVIFYGVSGQPIKTGTIKPMIYQQGDGTWEPFTGGKPSPNPDYEQEIKSVEIKEINSSSKNYFELSDIKPLTTETFKIDGNQLSVTGLWYAKKTIKLKKHTDYFVHAKKVSSTFYYQYAVANTENNNQVIGLSMGDNGFTFNTGNFSEYTFMFYCGNGEGKEGTSVYSDIMISVATSKQPYEPFIGKAEVPTDITLRSLPNGVCDTYENGVITRRVGVVELDGSSDEDWKLGLLNSNNAMQFYITINNAIKNTINLLCDRFIPKQDNSIGSCRIGNSFNVFVDKAEISTLEQFKTWLSQNPIKVQNELATPVIEKVNVPTIPSYYPYTNVWTDNEVDTNMQWELLSSSDNSLEVETLGNEVVKQVKVGSTTYTPTNNLLDLGSLAKQSDLSSYMPKSGGNFTGVPTIQNKAIATQEFVNAKPTILIGTASSPPFSMKPGDIYIQYEE